MNILLVGCGKMGSAMASGWLKSGIKPGAITIVDPVYKGKIKSCKTIAALPAAYAPDFVLLAIKPQIAAEVLPELARFKKAIFISILAGKTIKYLQSALGGATVIRTMPNLPAVIGQGVTAAVAGKKLSGSDKSAIARLLKPCGLLIWVKDEKLINPITAISGSGPAYVFLFAQKLLESAVKLGIDEVVAKTLVIQTLEGSIALAKNASEPLKTLKENVTSKGGTTAAALAVLEKNDALGKLLRDATKAANLRASELSE